MGLTTNQNIPNKEKDVAQPWSIKKLLPFASAVKDISKNFNSSFEMIALIMVFFSGFSEMFGRHLSWLWYVDLLFMAGCALFIKVKNKESSDNKP